MKLIPKVAISLAAAAALMISGAGVAVALGHAPAPSPVSKAEQTRAAEAHLDAVGPSTHLPSHTEDHQVTVTACSIFDTAKKGGKIGSGKSRSVISRGTVGFAPQGGTSGGCGVPDSATSVTVVLTASGASSGSGKLSWQPTGAAKSSRVLSYTKNQTMTTSAVLTLGSAAPGGKIVNSGASVNLQITVVGYTVPPIQGMISGTDGSIYSGTNRILSASRDAAGLFTVTVDTDVTFCTPSATGYFGSNVYASAYAFDTDKVHVYLWSLSSSTHLATAYDGYFYLTVDC